VPDEVEAGILVFGYHVRLPIGAVAADDDELDVAGAFGTERDRGSGNGGCEKGRLADADEDDLGGRGDGLVIDLLLPRSCMMTTSTSK
jgi:hypothetical protein